MAEVTVTTELPVPLVIAIIEAPFECLTAILTVKMWFDTGRMLIHIGLV